MFHYDNISCFFDFSKWPQGWRWRYLKMHSSHIYIIIDDSFCFEATQCKSYVYTNLIVFSSICSFLAVRGDRPQLTVGAQGPGFCLL